MTALSVIPAEELRLSALAFLRGPSALFEEGATQDDVAEFLLRPSVVNTLSAIAAEYKNEEILVGRARFMAKREMVRDIPVAVNVLARALRGPTYLRNEEGGIVVNSKGLPIITDRIDDMQIKAATEILDRLGVGGKESRGGNDVNLNVIFGDQTDARRELVRQDSAMTEEQRTISRERMRVIIDALAPKLGQISSIVSASVPEAKEFNRPQNTPLRIGKAKTKPKPKSK